MFSRARACYGAAAARASAALRARVGQWQRRMTSWLWAPALSAPSTAYHLKAAGASDVLLLERHSPAAGGTGKSAAAVRQNYSTKLMIPFG